MRNCVPDWVDNSHGLKVLVGDTNFYQIGKERAHQHQHQHQHQDQLHLYQNHLSSQRDTSVALVPNHDVSENLMQMGMQGEVGAHITGGFERASVPALDVPLVMSNPCAYEDEMLSWLRYPLEDSFDRNYCSEIFGELVNPHVQLVKDAYVHQTMRESENTHELNIEGMGCEQVGLQQLTNTASMHCPRAGFKSDAALAMGAGRAAGLLSQTGLEVFNGVRTHGHPSAFPKSLSSSATEPSVEQTNVGLARMTSQLQWQDGRTVGKKAFDNMDPIMTFVDTKKSSVLSPATPSMSSGFNFSLFSRPVATTLDSLRFVGAASGPTNVERARQPLAKDSPPLCELSGGDSNCSVVLNMPSSQQSTEFISQHDVARDGANYALSGWCLPASLPCRPDVLLHNETAELNNHVTCFSGSAITASDNEFRTFETTETTASPSRLSGSSNEKIAEEACTTTTTKQMSLPAEYSEDVEDVTANAKKPPPSGPRGMKRTRAAESHNESEKKRRNKINVRLKALQSLIPNSNKTDKASVLDEAIEYTKMLQAQVQFMSMRTGMFLPMPSGVHYVPVQQIPTLSHMGTGIGMGLGMGMDMSVGMRVMDVNAATAGVGVVGAGAGAGAGTSSSAGAGAGAGAALNLSPTLNQSPSRQVHAGARPPQTSSVPFIHDVSGCLPASSVSAPYKVMLPQQPLQPMLLNVQMNPDMYSALLQQRQPQENYISNATR